MDKFAIFATGLALLFLFACESSEGLSGDGGGGESPTGTFLDPRGGPDDGYEALDETCEQVDSAGYLDRFVTPMFRSVTTVDEIAWLVDGSHLWAIDINLAWNAERLSLTRLPGHPLAIEAGNEQTVLIAAGEVGLLVVDITVPAAPQLVYTVQTTGMALDLTVQGNLVYVAMGQQGLAVFDISVSGTPALVGQIDVPDFPNAVEVRDNLAYIASCASLSIVDVTDPTNMSVVGSYWVPEGHAKQLDVVETNVFVAGGEALFAFDATDPTAVLWTGFYNDPDAVGFYVNDVVVRDSTAYIAAGDESVRSVDVSRLGEVPLSNYLDERDGTEPPTLDGPVDLPPEDAMETETVAIGDPIGVAFSDNLLLVLGNFRWVGERLLRIMDISQPGVMADVGTYVQPNDTLGIDTFGELYVLHGNQGEELVVNAQGEGEDWFDAYYPVRLAHEQDGWFYLLSEEGGIYRWHQGDTTVSTVVGWEAYDMTLTPGLGFASDIYQNEVRGFALDGGAVFDSVTDDASFFGFSHLAAVDQALYAYDWATGAMHVLDLTQSGLPTLDILDVGMCEMYDIADFYSGLKDVRSKLFRSGDQVALMCPFDENNQSSVLIFDIFDQAHPYLADRIALPQGRFKDIAMMNGDVLALGFDNNTYESTLSLLVGEDPATFVWSGHANGLETDGETILVVDGDLGLLRFGLDGDDNIVLLEQLEL